MQNAYYEDFQRVHGELPGRAAPWVAKMRREAMDRFMALGFPTTRDEEWKYTDTKPIAKRHFAVAPADERVNEEALVRHLLGEAVTCRLVFVNGRFAPALSHLDKLPQGLKAGSLGAALDREPAVLEAYLGHCVEPERAFVALNSALFRDGAYVHLGRGVALNAPIELLYVSSGTAETAAHVRNLLVADEGSRAALIETHVSLEQGAYFTNAVTEVVVGPNAELEHYKLGQDGEQAYHVAATAVRQARDSRYTSHSVTLGGRLVRHDLHTVLDAEGSACTLNGLYVGGGRQHVDNNTRIDHRKANTTSRERYKGVLDGHARGIFRGRVVVHPDAQHTDAQQSNNNLLLSENAEAESLPQLEIYADDVKCAHGSTVGQLDANALFYLRSRALDEGLARSLLIYAFARDVIEPMTVIPVRSRLEAQLTGRLLEGRALEELVA